jgi:hypothetical protein
MYLWAFGYFFLLMIPYANVAAWLILAISGNYLYYRFVKGKILRVKASQSSGDIGETLSEIGGVNKWVPVVAVIVTITAFFMFLLGLILSAC